MLFFAGQQLYSRTYYSLKDIYNPVFSGHMQVRQMSLKANSNIKYLHKRSGTAKALYHISMHSLHSTEWETELVRSASPWGCNKLKMEAEIQWCSHSAIKGRKMTDCSKGILQLIIPTAHSVIMLAGSVFQIRDWKDAASIGNNKCDVTECLDLHLSPLQFIP